MVAVACFLPVRAKAISTTPRTYLDVSCLNHPILSYDRAEMSTRIYMIDIEWTVGYGEPITVAKYEQLYHILSYEDSNCVDTF